MVIVPIITTILNPNGETSIPNITNFVQDEDISIGLLFASKAIVQLLGYFQKNFREVWEMNQKIKSGYTIPTPFVSYEPTHSVFVVLKINCVVRRCYLGHGFSKFFKILENTEANTVTGTFIDRTGYELPLLMGLTVMFCSTLLFAVFSR